MKERNAYVLYAYPETPNSAINKLISNYMVKGGKPRCVGCMGECLNRDTFYKMNQEERKKYIDTIAEGLKLGDLFMSSGTTQDISGNVVVNKEE